MGKSKKRTIYKGKNNVISRLSREDAIEKVIAEIKNLSPQAVDLITLFGMSCEELLEAGAQFEDVMSLRGIVND